METKNKITKLEWFMIFMCVGCSVISFPAESVLLAIAGVGFGIGALGIHKQQK